MYNETDLDKQIYVKKEKTVVEANQNEMETLINDNQPLFLSISL